MYTYLEWCDILMYACIVQSLNQVKCVYLNKYLPVNIWHFFFKGFLFSVYVCFCLHVYMYTIFRPVIQGGQKRTLDSLTLLWPPKWMLWIHPWSSKTSNKCSSGLRHRSSPICHIFMVKNSKPFPEALSCIGLAIKVPQCNSFLSSSSSLTAA